MGESLSNLRNLEENYKNYARMRRKSCSTIIRSQPKAKLKVTNALKPKLKEESKELDIGDP